MHITKIVLTTPVPDLGLMSSSCSNCMSVHFMVFFTSIQTKNQKSSLIVEWQDLKQILQFYLSVALTWLEVKNTRVHSLIDDTMQTCPCTKIQQTSLKTTAVLNTKLSNCIFICQPVIILNNSVTLHSHFTDTHTHTHKGVLKNYQPDQEGLQKNPDVRSFEKWAKLRTLQDILVCVLCVHTHTHTVLKLFFLITIKVNCCMLKKDFSYLF